MKKILLYFFFILVFFLVSIPRYVECNNLTIISKIEIMCNSSYEIKYYEIIPLKQDNGVQYKYKTYIVHDDNLLHGIYLIEKDKYIYKKHAQYHISCTNKEEILKIIKET